MQAKEILSALITKCDEDFHTFLSNSIKHFYKELTDYMDHTQDFGVFEYATERSIVSLFVNGLVRNENSATISAIQEYRLYTIDGRSRRPDIFIKYGTTAIWVECKYDNPMVLSQVEWDLEKWLQIENLIFKQVHCYYEIEGSKLNNTFEKHYIMTLNVKPIRDKDSYIASPNYSQLIECSKQSREDGSGWFYSDSHRFPSQPSSDIPFIEVCGTFRKMYSTNECSAFYEQDNIQ